MLLREADPKVDPRIQVFLDRILLRFFDNPSLVIYLHDQNVQPDGTIELVFCELPQNIVPRVADIVNVKQGEAYSFNDPHSQVPRTGYRFKPDEEDLKGIVL